MKYIPADKLIAEIERLTNQKKEKLKRFSDEDYTCSVASSINCKLCGNEEVLSIITSLQQEQPEVDLEGEVEFYCINKKVKMTIQELINYYIDTECAETAIECGF